MGRSRHVAIAASRARKRAARATRPPQQPLRAVCLRRMPQVWVDPSASRLQRAEHVHVLLVRRDRRRRHGWRRICAGRPEGGPLPARRAHSKLDTYACLPCDASAATAAAGGWFAPDAPGAGRSLRVAIAASRAPTRAARVTRPPLPPRRAAYLRRVARGWADPGASRSQRARTYACHSCNATAPAVAVGGGCRRAAQVWAAPVVSRSQRAEHVHVQLVRRDRNCRHGGRRICASRPEGGLYPARHDRSELSMYTCCSCDVTAPAVAADGWFAPGGPSVGCSRRFAIAASRTRTHVVRAT